jgi:hypothetical protein
MVELGRADLSVTPTEVSASGGATVDVGGAIPGDVVSVRVGATLVGTDRADALGVAHVEGPLPPGTAAGDTVSFVASDGRTDSGWTSAVYSSRVREVVTP